MNITTLKTRKNLIEIKCNPVPRGESVDFFLMSDPHIDNPKCKREVLFAHLDEAKRRGAKVIINGDLFCFMQGKYDPRRTKSDIRPEHNVNNYLDAVIDDTVDLLAPYKDIIVMVADGNHETAILKNMETNVLERFCVLFNERTGGNIVHAPYNGWISIALEYAENAALHFRIKYKHGYGGGGPVTKGTIQHAREAMWTEGADAIWMGHTHDCYALPVAVERFMAHPQQGYRAQIATVYDIRTPSYKHEYLEGGWAIERGHPPRVIGGMWMRLTIKSKEKGSRWIKAHFTPEVEEFYD